MSDFLWGVYPYLCAVLFFLVPFIRMVYRPFSWSTRASGLFGRTMLGVASLFLHWGLFLLFVGHLVALVAGLMGKEGGVTLFYWMGLVGGVLTLIGSTMALVRRFMNPEVKAMSQHDDYLVHFFLIAIVGLALYQVLMLKIFGVSYTAATWFASIWQFSPQPELMGSASLISKLHIFFALTFFAYFPFTKLVHLWTYPVNFFVRAHQSMRTQRYRFQRRWDLDWRSDKTWLLFGALGFLGIFVACGFLLGHAAFAGESDTGSDDSATTSVDNIEGLDGYPLYVSQCARCHGLGGEGDGMGADSPTFSTIPRDLTAARYHFVSTKSGVASDADLHRTIRRGLAGTGMPGSDLSSEQIGSLVGVLRTLQEKPSNPGPAFSVGKEPTSTEASISRGKILYKNNCATCHGADGSGGEAIKDWRGLAITPANLKAGNLKAGSNSRQIYMRIVAGIPGAEGDNYLMPSFRWLPEDDRWALIHYLKGKVVPGDVTRR